MRIRGRQISNWWLVLAGGLLLIASPILLIGYFAANNLAGAIVGPPAMWNRTGHTPPRGDVVGEYVEGQRHLDQETRRAPATLALRADGTMSVSGLPFDAQAKTCIVSGSGSWGLVDDGSAKVALNLLTTSSHDSCQANIYTSIEMAGHSKPYKVYWVEGDPDSGTGVWLVKK